MAFFGQNWLLLVRVKKLAFLRTARLYTDMSKAFDKVNHDRLLSKLWNI